MKILTCVKHVPTSAVTPRISSAGNGIEEEGLSYEVNEPDLYAIEEALYQRSAHGGSVTAVTVGAGKAKEAIHVAYAKGVDHGIHVVDETYRGTNSALSVRAVAELVKESGSDLILTGIQADDDLLGQFGIALAEELKLPVVTAVTEIRADPANRTVTVVRELGGGYKEELVLGMPCVLTIQFGIRPVRYTAVMAVVRARSKKMETIDAKALGISMDGIRALTTVRVIELSYPKDSGNCEFLDGPVQDMVSTLIDRLAKAGVM